ncbi:minor capsid protein [Holdemanella biformis]|uniref:minor capsid protein n=1 Tax=Holdemanella biformis TaxID=1735 RepID=UPI002673B480|nr:minor capsid protein [Holdemanella biformis]
MSSKTYWRDRELEWKKKRLKDEQEYADEIQEIYANMMDSVEKEIESFFSRYANKENITMAEAKKRVSNIDIEAYKRKAKKYVKEKNFSDEANEQMRLYNLAMKVNRLELLKANIGLELVVGHDELKSYTGNKLEGAYLEEIKRNASILGDTVIDNAKMAKTVADSSFKNATFSERIWVNQDQLKNSLSSVLSNALIQGKNPREFIPQIRKKFDVSRCNAERLLRTEIARVQTQAQAESYEANGIDEYEYIACSLKDVCPLCKEMNGKTFKLKDMKIGENAPPLHPNCHCALAPYSDRKEYEKWIDGLANGEHDLRFDEWKQKQSEKSKSFLMSKVKEKIEKTSNDKRYADLSTEWKNDFNIEIDESVKELNYSSVSRALKSLRNMLNQYPEINEYVKRISTSDNGAMVFRPSKNDISLNPEYFKDPEAYSKLIKEQVRKGYWIKGTTIESDMVHEAAHVLEFVFLNRNINYKNTLQKENAWEECNESGKIVLEAFNNLRAKGIIKGNRLKESLNNISGYASKNNSEALAEAFSDCFINGTQAYELSKEIKRLVDIKLKG